MSAGRGTRSSTAKTDVEGSSTTMAKTAKVLALRKVFFITKALLDDSTQHLRLERFYHPGKAQLSLFITRADQDIMEVLEFAEPRRSWLVDSEVCSNGHIYITVPIDVTFLALHHIRKHCSEKALALDNIGDAKDASTLRLLRHFARKEQLECVADIKKAGDMLFYKYNKEKTIAWLALKAQRLAQTLRTGNVHCGHSALSQNYVRNEQTEQEQNSVDYLRMACDIVGDYVDLELHEQLKQYLEIPPETLSGSNKENEKLQKQTNAKRKSLQSLNAGSSKKLKVDVADGGAIGQLQNNSVLDENKDSDDSGSGAGEASPIELVEVVMSPKKERTPTAKEKALAKSAKGTRSIASFFKK